MLFLYIKSYGQLKIKKANNIKQKKNIKLVHHENKKYKKGIKTKDLKLLKLLCTCNC